MRQFVFTDFEFRFRSGSDTVIAIRLKSKNWFDVLIIDAENPMPMR